MKSAYSQALYSVVFVSLLPLLGLIGIVLSAKTLDRIKGVLTGFATGALLGDCFVHLLPQTYSRIGNPVIGGLLACGGLLIFFLLDTLIRLGNHPHTKHESTNVSLITIALTGDALHNFTDGLLIGAGYLISPVIGLSTTVAIVLHEIPHELGDIGVLLEGGLPIKRAIKVNFLCGFSALAGTIVALAAGTQMTAFSAYLLPVAAGSFLYLSGSVLLPLLLAKPNLRDTGIQLLLIGLGLGLMLLLAQYE